MGLALPAVAPAQTTDGVLNTMPATRQPVESEITLEGLGSFGHYHVFAYTWWSYLKLGGVEYDRHSWGRFMGARRDYAAEIFPIVVLRQPSKTDSFGDPLSKTFDTLYGLAILPAGTRLTWRDHKSLKPYYAVIGGMIGFNQKALSYAGTYQNFCLHQSTGVEINVKPRWAVRLGVSDFHFSNGFMAPSNPGIDEMMYTGGLTWRLERAAAQ